MPDIEYRDVAELNRRADADSDGFDGYAATFMRADSYGTAFAKGAFRKTLGDRKGRIPLLYQHNPDWAIGAPAVLREDKTGLWHESGVVDDGAEGTVALKRLRGGVPFGMSFGFQTRKDRSAEEDDVIDVSQTPGLKPSDVRVITEVKLWEISLVTFPANEAASITAVRADLGADVLTQTLDELRAGTLSPSRRSLVAALVAAWSDATGPEGQTPPPIAAEARRNVKAEVDLLFLGFDLPMEQSA